MNSPRRKAILLAIVSAVVALAVALGIVLLRSPAEERTIRIDARRVEDLRQISAAVNLFWTRHRQLPASLGELAGEPGIAVGMADPLSASPYDYRVLGATGFELCASFDAPTDAPPRHGTDFWAHGAGRQCFQLQAKDVRQK